MGKCRLGATAQKSLTPRDSAPSSGDCDGAVGAFGQVEVTSPRAILCSQRDLRHRESRSAPQRCQRRHCRHRSLGAEHHRVRFLRRRNAFPGRRDPVRAGLQCPERSARGPDATDFTRRSRGGSSEVVGRELRASMRARCLIALGYQPPPRSLCIAAGASGVAGWMALENEVEGCVHETVGAALCWRQSFASETPELRNVMQKIGEDETRHAELAQDISEWSRTLLTTEEKQALDQARARAINEVLAEMSQGGDDMVSRQCGLPAVAETR